MDKPMQFGISVWSTDNSLVSYDKSFLNCMGGVALKISKFKTIG